MKLLFDENLSPRLVDRLADLLPDSRHVREVGLLGQPDAAIWDYAAAQRFVIISKDDDFHHFSFLRGSPPKVIHLRLGNCTTAEIETLLRGAHATLLRFEADPGSALLLLP